MNIADVQKPSPRGSRRGEWHDGGDILRARFLGRMPGVQIIRSAVYTGVNEQRKDLHNAADVQKPSPRGSRRGEWHDGGGILGARFLGRMPGVQIIRSAVYTGVNEQRKDLHNAADVQKPSPRGSRQ